MRRLWIWRLGLWKSIRVGLNTQEKSMRDEDKDVDERYVRQVQSRLIQCSFSFLLMIITLWSIQ